MSPQVRRPRRRAADTAGRHMCNECRRPRDMLPSRNPQQAAEASLQALSCLVLSGPSPAAPMGAEQLETSPDRMMDHEEDARLSRRAETAGVSPPPRLPPDAAPSWHQPPALRVHIAAAWFEILVQLVITCTQWRNSESKGSLLAFTAAKFFLSAFVLGWPDTFWAHRQGPGPGCQGCSWRADVASHALLVLPQVTMPRTPSCFPWAVQLGAVPCAVVPHLPCLPPAPHGRLAVMPLMRIAMHLLPHVRRTGVSGSSLLARPVELRLALPGLPLPGEAAWPWRNVSRVLRRHAGWGRAGAGACRPPRPGGGCLRCGADDGGCARRPLATDLAPMCPLGARPPPLNAPCLAAPGAAEFCGATSFPSWMSLPTADVHATRAGPSPRAPPPCLQAHASWAWP